MESDRLSFVGWLQVLTFAFVDCSVAKGAAAKTSSGAQQDLDEDSRKEIVGGNNDPEPSHSAGAASDYIASINLMQVRALQNVFETREH